MKEYVREEKKARLEWVHLRFKNQSEVLMICNDEDNFAKITKEGFN